MRHAFRNTCFAILASLSLLLGAATAHADTAGAPGKIAGLEHNDDSSDDYATFQHGTLFVDDGGDTPTKYKWGGSWCPNRFLDIEQVTLLLEAMRGKLLVLPYWKTGNAGTRCLVSFTLTAKKSYVEQIAK